MNSYILTRKWFDFAFEHPECKVYHTALFCWIIELNNRLGWKPQFGLPTHDTMEGLSIGNKNTYLSALRDLAKWGFIEIIKESKNQYQACIIEICRSKSEPAQQSALDTALIQHSIQQCSGTGSGIDTSIVPIDKPINQETLNQETISIIHSAAREAEIDEAIKEYFEVPKQPGSEEEKSCAKKEEVPSAAEADEYFNKHYASLYELIRKDNASAGTPELRLSLLEHFWAENLDLYKKRMPPWSDIIKHFRNWVPKYSFVKQEQNKQNENQNDTNAPTNTKTKRNFSLDRRDGLKALKQRSTDFLRQTGHQNS